MEKKLLIRPRHTQNTQVLKHQLVYLSNIRTHRSGTIRIIEINWNKQGKVLNLVHQKKSKAPRTYNRWTTILINVNDPSNTSRSDSDDEIQTVHPSPLVPPVHVAATTLVEPKVPEDIDDNMRIVALRPQDRLDAPTKAAKRKRTEPRKCCLSESSWSENMDWPPPKRKLKNGVMIPV